jgi:hypothetical protein
MNVSNYMGQWTKLDLDIVVRNELAYIMKLDVDMLAPSMIFRVLSEFNCCLIIA